MSIVKKWFSNMIKPKRHTPIIEPYLNKSHEHTMKRKISVPMSERRVAAARGVELETLDKDKVKWV